MVEAGPVGWRQVVAAVVCVLAVVAGVQLLDPFAPTVAQPTGDPPDESEPAALLRYSMAELNATSYTLTVSVNDSGDLTRFWYSEVSYAEREVYFEVGPADGTAKPFYVHADGAWVKEPGSGWHHFGLFDRDNRFQRSTVPVPYRRGAVTADRTRVHNRTADALWVRVDGGDQTAIPSGDSPVETYVLYELDPETYRLRRSVEYASGTAEVQTVYEFEGYGETTVDRPAGTESLAVNLLSDLLR